MLMDIHHHLYHHHNQLMLDQKKMEIRWFLSCRERLIREQILIFHLLQQQHLLKLDVIQ